jgi:hypothetical protein
MIIHFRRSVFLWMSMFLSDHDRPVLEHGPRSSTYMQVLWLKNHLRKVKATAYGLVFIIN